MLLKDAKDVRVGTVQAKAVYQGANKVWPSAVVVPPTFKGYTSVSTTGTPALVNPSSGTVGTPIATGDWMVLIWGWNSNTGFRTGTAVTPWRERIAPVGVGTMGWALWSGVRRAGDTTYSIPLIAGAQQPSWMLAWGAGPGPDENAWVQGAIGTRAGQPTQFEVTAPSINAPAGSLVLTLGLERTTATETLAQITIDNGFTKQVMVNPTSAAQFLATKPITVAGATGPTKVVWLNSHGTNAQLVQLAIPGVSA